MNKNWYTGDTGLFPLDYSIKRATKYSWTSHIREIDDSSKYNESMSN